MARIVSVIRLLLAIYAITVLPPAMAADGKPEDILQLMQEAGALARGGKFTDAIKVSEAALAIIEKMGGKQHPVYLSQLANIADLYGLKGDSAEAERRLLEVLALREKILGRDHADVAATLASLANIYTNLARYDEAEAALDRTLRIREKALQKSDPNYGFTFVNLGRLYMMRSRFAEAEQLFQKAYTLLSQHLPADHMFIPVVTNNLAEAKRALGRFAEAETLLRQALQRAEQTHGVDTQFTAPMLNNLAQLYRQQGRYAEAEALMRRELAITEKTRGTDSLSASVSLNNLGTLMTTVGRPRDALVLLKRSLEIQKRLLGAEHPDVAKSLNNLADAYSWLKMPEEAEPLFRQSIALRERAAGPRDLSVAIALDNLVTFYFNEKRFAEAENLARRALEIRVERQSPDHPELGNSLSNLATLLDRLGRPGEARPLHERAAAIREASLGKLHPELAIGLSNLGANRLDERDWQTAHDTFKRANEIWIARRAALGGGGASGQAGDQDIELKRFSDSFIGLIWAAYELRATADATRQKELSEESFAALQWATVSSAANAVGKMSARIAAGSGALGGVVREQQDLTNELEALDRSLLSAISSAPAARSPKAEADLKQRAEAVRKRLTEVTTTLSAKFPEFAAVTSPQPRSIAQVRKALRPDEALYAITLSRGGSFAWVVTPETERWVRIDRTTSDIEDDVTALRCGLDAAAWFAPKTRCPQLTGQSYGEAEERAGRQPRFDLERSHALYSALFGQVEDLIRGRHLIVVPADALTQLPFQVLVTERPPATGAEADRYWNAAWLARTTPITVLPSVNSLEALRVRSATSAAAEPYLGIGNPMLDGPDRRYAGLASLAQSKQSCAVPSSQQIAAGPQGQRGMTRMINSTGHADPDFLRMQPPLPETADELCAVANDLRVGPAAVRLGEHAIEADVKRMSEAGTLKRYRVLHFATHGAMVGEVAGASEPGLILTPPKKATDIDDGYLSASEIAALQLDADLVILSACNTAAAGADDAQTLSGMARSFFYAGARALLVSHWAVNSVATVKLITGALAITAREKGVDHAEALRRSMLAVIDSGTGASAHPAIWAPFVVVGGLSARQ